MSRLPPIKRFVIDDFGGITEIVPFATKLFYPLNLFLNAVYSAMNNGLTLNQNTIGMVATNASIIAGSTGIATTTINWKFPQSPPQGVFVMNCTQSGAAVQAPLISWSYNSGVVTITLQFLTISSGAIVQGAAGTYALTFWLSGG